MTDLAPPPPPTDVSDEAFLLAYLESHEAPCPACGYNAHKLREPRCPECGITLVLKAVSLQPISKSWIAMMVASAATAGLGGLILGILVHRGWPHFRRLTWFDEVVPYYFLAMIPLPALLMWLRRPITHLPRGRRISIAVLFCILTMVMFYGLYRGG